GVQSKHMLARIFIEDSPLHSKIRKTQLLSLSKTFFREITVFILSITLIIGLRNISGNKKICFSSIEFKLRKTGKVIDFYLIIIFIAISFTYHPIRVIDI